MLSSYVKTSCVMGDNTLSKSRMEKTISPRRLVPETSMSRAGSEIPRNSHTRPRTEVESIYLRLGTVSERYMFMRWCTTICKRYHQRLMCSTRGESEASLGWTRRSTGCCPTTHTREEKGSTVFSMYLPKDTRMWAEQDVPTFQNVSR